MGITVTIKDTGLYKLAFDLVSEGICWFENNGSQPAYITLQVS
jgi:hypothetical protein